MSRSVQIALTGILCTVAGFAVGSRMRSTAGPSGTDHQEMPSLALLDPSSRGELDETHTDTTFAHWVDEHAPAAEPTQIATISYDQLKTSAEATADKDQHAARDVRKRQIIREYLPNADEDVVDIWALEYATASADELRFILQQKQALALPTLKVTPQPVADVTIAPRNAVQESRHLFQEQLMQSNLLNLRTVGFRRRDILELPADVRPMVQRSFLCFDSGPLVTTAQPLHVAIVDEPNLFFQLSSDRFTRCGMFRVLASGRIGFETSEGVFTVSEAAVTSAQASIQADGSIVCHTDTGVPNVIDTMQLARISNPQALTSEDGVLFRLTKEAFPPEMVAAAGYIRSGCLELSNARQSP